MFLSVIKTSRYENSNFTCNNFTHNNTVMQEQDNMSLSEHKKVVVTNVTDWIQNELIRVAQTRERLELVKENKGYILM